MSAVPDLVANLPKLVGDLGLRLDAGMVACRAGEDSRHPTDQSEGEEACHNLGAEDILGGTWADLADHKASRVGRSDSLEESRDLL